MEEKEYVDIFPIREENLPKIYAYKIISEIEILADKLEEIGGKLQYLLRQHFKRGHWVWTSKHILADELISDGDIREFLENNLWKNDSQTFGDIENISLDKEWEITPQAIADFVARGLFKDIIETSKENSKHIGKVRIKPEYYIRGYVVNGKPSIGISVSFGLIYSEDLWSYMGRIYREKKISDLKDLEKEVEGLLVRDKTSNMKGEIVKITGEVKKHRDRLIRKTQREEMKEIIEKASDEELVVKVLSNRKEYEYVASALNIIITPENSKKLGVEYKNILKEIRIEPKKRAELIKKISEKAKEKGFIGDAYRSDTHPEYFPTKSNDRFSLLFGGNKKVEFEYSSKYQPKDFFDLLKEHGFYHLSKENIRLGVISLLRPSIEKQFLKEIYKNLNNLGFKIEIVGEERPPQIDRVSIEKASSALEEKEPDIILAFLPKSFSNLEEDFEEDEVDPYHILKSITVGKGIPSQVVLDETMSNKYAVSNIILGILGKTGNIPFVLGDGVKDADFIVGIDVARRPKERLEGSINVAATVRIYKNNGELLKYVIKDDISIEGETIPRSVLVEFFPSTIFSGKRVIIHRDGYFRGNEKEVLKQWAEEINAEFLLVEIIKSGVPRLYSDSQGAIKTPKKGSVFKMNETKALLVSTPPPFGNATPRPLYIKTEAPFRIEQAIESVLSLTFLHYGSLQQPRLPVTIYYSDRIAYLALKGIKPKNAEGRIPYWL